MHPMLNNSINFCHLIYHLSCIFGVRRKQLLISILFICIYLYIYEFHMGYTQLQVGGRLTNAIAIETLPGMYIEVFRSPIPNPHS